MLYPLKFKPILKDRIWGGRRLVDHFGKKTSSKADEKYGESWELSAVKESISVVSNGFLAGNTLEELTEIYMGDLVGDKVFQEFGEEFPLLIKLIDTADFLSVQVHPDNEMAGKLHSAKGKSEMWYILDSEPDSTIITGFNREISKDEYVDILSSGKLKGLLKYQKVSKDDFFFIPARTVHAIGKGVLLVEIQQSSDITYRIYDWDRFDENGISRELHPHFAVDAIDFSSAPSPRMHLPIALNEQQELVHCPFFKTNRIVFDKAIEKDFFPNDSFTVYICLEGCVEIYSFENEVVKLQKGDIALIPAAIDGATLKPMLESKILEVYL